jgi:molybdate transport system substrate-binding protein
MKLRFVSTTLGVGVLLVLAGFQTAAASEIKVLSTPTMKTAIDELRPQFERMSGHTLIVVFDGVAGLKRQIEAGEAFDVAILLPPAIDDLMKQGKVAAGTRTDIARTAVGVGIRTGAPRPDISSVDAFKRSLLGAKSISYSPDSASSAYFVSLIDRLAIAAEVKPLLKPAPGGRVVEAVANGDADLVVITTSLTSSGSTWSVCCRPSCRTTLCSARVWGTLQRTALRLTLGSNFC